MKKSNIVLVGFMGTGKTSVAKYIAKKCPEMTLVDMDALIVEREGRSINDIFATDGEPYFRNLERELSKELAQGSDQIISTGGGIVLNNENIEAFEQSGLVVCLTAEAEEIINRVSRCKSRPLLSGDKEKQVRELLEKRKPLYEAIPFKIKTDNYSPKSIAEKIITKFNS